MIYGPNNFSLYAIPAAWVLAIAPHAYGMSLYSKISGKAWDNSHPRLLVSQLAHKENLSADERKVLRAEAAQQNGFENITLFAVSILAGNVAKLPSAQLNSLALGYLASRAIYNLLYINTADNSTSNLRTGVFLSGIGICMTLIVKSGNILY